MAFFAWRKASRSVREFVLFAEQLGTLDRLDDSGRVRVLLEIMGATVPVQLERKIVRAA
jgi:hypothetical protein